MNSGTVEAPVWTQELKICAYDVDYTRRATIAGLSRFFVDAAWNHAEALGVGFNQLAEQGKFWVLSRFLLEVRQYPEWGSTATLRTWPRGVKSVFAMRDFEMIDPAGSCLAAGSSAWLVLDASSKWPQRLNKLLPHLAGLQGRAALGRDPEKVPDCDRWDTSSSAIVRYSDIDVNRHVTSSRYIGWILDTYPPGFHADHSVRLIEVNYLDETREAETLTVQTVQTAPLAYTHSLLKDNGKEVCRARLEWQNSHG